MLHGVPQQFDAAFQRFVTGNQAAQVTKKVDLPEPDGPNSATISPRWTVKINGMQRLVVMEGLLSFSTRMTVCMCPASR